MNKPAPFRTLNALIIETAKKHAPPADERAPLAEVIARENAIEKKRALLTERITSFEGRALDVPQAMELSKAKQELAELPEIAGYSWHGVVYKGSKDR